MTSSERQKDDDEIVFVIGDGPMKRMTFEEFSATGRVPDCDCRLIQCVCAEARKHKAECRYRKALTCAVAVACEHNSDVCPECDPCTCEDPTP